MDVNHYSIASFMHTAAPLPDHLGFPVRMLSTVHWWWRWNYKKNLYSDPNQWFGLAAGHLTNQFCGDGWFRTISHLVLITHRTKCYAQQVLILRDEGRRVAEAIDGIYEPYPAIDWRIKNEVLRKQKHQLDKIKIRIIRIFEAILAFSKQLFTVTMHAVEVYDAFYRRQESPNEFFVNVNECASDFAAEGAQLSEFLRENSKTIQAVLDHWSIRIDLEWVMTHFERTVDATRRGTDRYQMVSREFAIGVKMVLTQNAVMFGCSRFIPTQWWNEVRL